MLEFTPHDHPSLELAAFVTDFPATLAELSTSAELLVLLRPDAPSPFERSGETRAAVRDLLRHGGYKPTGRGKPASEYLVRAATEGKLSSINAAVDACNAVSLHGGLPISVVDLDRCELPLRVCLAAEGATYVFNASGQEIRVSGLLSLHDAAGPCANAVKDAQRTKTTGDTRRTLSLIWGTRALPGLAEKLAGWYRELLEGGGASCTDVGLRAAER